MNKKPLKILGHRRQEINPSWEDANRWLHTIAELRQGKGICPKGVYRFKTFEEADEWMNRMLAMSSLETQPIDDLVELCCNLNAAGAAYVVIGGFAVIHYGFVRGTGDIDLLVDHSEQNMVRIQQGLLYLPDKAAKDLNLTDVKEYHVVRVADEIVVDLIEQACDVTYQQVKAGLFSSLNNLIKMGENRNTSILLVT